MLRADYKGCTPCGKVSAACQEDAPHMTLFFIERGGQRVPLHQPEDVRPYLAEPEKHWRPGYSAAELAKAWIGRGEIPDAVRETLATADDLADAQLQEGLFEHQTPLPSRGAASQTDLLAILLVHGRRIVVGVEGKRDEPFGPRVRDWNDGPGKAARLEALCALLELSPETAGELRYQLLHRTAAALLEAERRESSEALVLVHSFSPKAASFDAFADFTDTLGAPVPGTGAVGPSITRHGIALRFAWVHDPKPIPHS